MGENSTHFQRRSGIDIYALRIGNVIEPHEYAELVPNYLKHLEVASARNAFVYSLMPVSWARLVELFAKKWP